MQLRLRFAASIQIKLLKCRSGRLNSSIFNVVPYLLCRITKAVRALLLQQQWLQVYNLSARLSDLYHPHKRKEQDRALR